VSGLGSKLEGKDLVTVGIYSVVYFVSMMVVAFLGFIPIFIPLLAVLVPVLGGIPFMLFISKTNKFWMVTLLSLINGILMFITGMGYFSIVTGLIFGFISDLVFKSAEYKDKKKCILGYGVFSMWLFGNFMPFYIGREAQFSMLVKGYGQEYALALEKFMPVWGAPILLLASFVFGILGGVIGTRACKKHFKRAGIA
jgi:energy-coupling factor transport system substrate-specific component